MEQQYKFLQNRFRRIFFTTLLFLVGVLIGSISVPAGFFMALVVLVGLLIYVVRLDKQYQKHEEEE